MTPQALTPLLAWGVAPLPRRAGRVDTWARDELTDHLAALCRLLHGRGTPRACTDCSALLRTPEPTGLVGNQQHRNQGDQA